MHCVLAVSLLVLLCFTVLPVVHSQTKPGPPSAPPVTVTVIEVSPRALPIYTEYTGTTDAPETAEIRARVDGYIEQKLFERRPTHEGQGAPLCARPAHLSSPRCRRRKPLWRRQRRTCGSPKKGWRCCAPSRDWRRAERRWSRPTRTWHAIRPLVKAGGGPAR